MITCLLVDLYYTAVKQAVCPGVTLHPTGPDARRGETCCARLVGVEGALPDSVAAACNERNDGEEDEGDEDQDPRGPISIPVSRREKKQLLTCRSS